MEISRNMPARAAPMRHGHQRRHTGQPPRRALTADSLHATTVRAAPPARAAPTRHAHQGRHTGRRPRKHHSASPGPSTSRDQVAVDADMHHLPAGSGKMALISMLGGVSAAIGVDPRSVPASCQANWLGPLPASNAGCCNALLCALADSSRAPQRPIIPPNRDTHPMV